jgi:MurNAc alpha-1-phosphate uridylyltransferase
MLMAAGLGTRLRPFSDRIAKPLVPVMGVPCAQFVVDALATAGVTRLVANVHHLPDATRQGLESLDLHGTELLVSDESDRLLGSAGGVRKALDLLGEGPFFAANADVLCSIDWGALARAHARLRSQWGVTLTLALMPIPPFAGEEYREIRLTPDGSRITGLGDKGKSGLMYVGCAVFEASCFAHIPVGRPAELVPEVLEPAIRSGSAGAFVMDPGTPWLWMDVGSPQLWWRAHVELIERMETASLPKPWRVRIERAAIRRGQRIWTGRHLAGRMDWSDSSGPCFWDALMMDRLHPRGKPALAPGMIVYGEPPAEGARSGIGALGFWSPVDPLKVPGVF